MCWVIAIVVGFSFTSIEVPLTWSADHNGYIHLRVVRKFSLLITVSLMASLTFPQSLFWFVYPGLILVWFWHDCLVNFLGRLQATAPDTIPVYNIIISPTAHQPSLPVPLPPPEEISTSQAAGYIYTHTIRL